MRSTAYRRRLDVVNVVERRQEWVELAAFERLAFGDLQIRPGRIPSVVQSPVDDFVLDSAVDADQAPGQVIVHRRGGAGRHDEREETERSILGTIERVLPDALAHPARLVRLRAGIR